MHIFTASYVLSVLALLVLYWLIPRRAQNALLCAAAVVLCASWDVRFALVLFGTTLLEYAIDLRLEFGAPELTRSRWMWTAVVLDVATIVSFKYLDVVSLELDSLAHHLGLGLDLTTAKVMIPLGLSFYTLQRLSHTLDIYYRVSEPCRSVLDYLTFASFFPLLHTGPIERGKNLLPQLVAERRFSWDDVQRGVWLVGLGAFKKAFIGDHCGTLARALLPIESSEASTLGTLFGIYAYAFELYGDFAGYSDIARGTASLFGIHVMENFHAPYLSQNVSELWQRWHISLSSFLDDYVYRPSAMALRGLGTPGIVIAIYLTFLASALWHGRGTTFLVWGALHASALAVFTATKKLRKRLKRNMPRAILRTLSTLVTFHVVCLGYVFLRAPTLHGALVTLGKKLLFARLLGPDVLPRAAAVLALAGLLTALDFIALRTKDEAWIFTRPLWVRSVCYAAMLVCVVKFYAPAEPFVYLQF